MDILIHHLASPLVLCDWDKVPVPLAVRWKFLLQLLDRHGRIGQQVHEPPLLAFWNASMS